MHIILPDLLLYSYYAELISGKFLGIDLLFGSFGPCPSGYIQFLGRTGRIHCQCPILLCFDMKPGEVNEIDFKEKTAGFGHILGS
jgi:hypothetical protein